MVLTMRGLRTQESEKFNKFFSLIQSEAEKKGAVFFADAGDGREFETPDIEGEDMMGWLIPNEKTGEFEPLWETSDVDDSWTDFFLWAVWANDNGKIKIQFGD